jgi:hypothetical protein
MWRRAFHVLWLLFATLWFAVIAPGHTRGTIRLAGSPAEEATCEAMSSCCPMESMGHEMDQATGDHAHHDPAAAGDKEKSHKHHPTDPAECCAICYLNSVLDTPPSPVFVTVCSGLLLELEPLEPVRLSSLIAAVLLHIRGPPPVLA